MGCAELVVAFGFFFVGWGQLVWGWVFIGGLCVKLAANIQVHAELSGTKLATNSQHAHCVGIVQPAKTETKQKLRLQQPKLNISHLATSTKQGCIQLQASGLKRMRSSVADTNGGNLNHTKDSALDVSLPVFAEVQERLV